MKNLLAAIVLLVCFTPSVAQRAIHVQKKGAGPPVLLLPGFTTPGSIWDSTIQKFSDYYESHTVSYAGFNGLEPIAVPWYDQVKDQLVEYVKHENLTNLVIIGHSMGGNLAVDLAAELPKHVIGLILVESIPCMRELMMPGVPASSLQYDSPYNREVLDMSNDAFRQMAIGLSKNMTSNQAKVDSLISWTLRADRKTYVYGYTDLLKLDLRDKLKKISINTLILGASFPDRGLVLSNYEKQYTNLTSKQILIADDCKHFIMFDQPDWLHTNINKYLEANGQD